MKVPMEEGRAVCTRRGDRVAVCMEAEPRQRGLYRGVLTGERGRMELGTLLPEGGCLRLHREIPIARLEKVGCWPITGARAELTYAFCRESTPGRESASARESTPSRASAPGPGCSADRRTGEGWSAKNLDWPPAQGPIDPLLARWAGVPCLFRTDEDGFFLAFPWSARQPFPMEPIFCFARVRPVGGRLRVVYRFDRQGRPVAG